MLPIDFPQFYYFLISIQWIHCWWIFIRSLYAIGFYSLTLPRTELLELHSNKVDFLWLTINFDSSTNHLSLKCHKIGQGLEGSKHRILVSLNNSAEGSFFEVHVIIRKLLVCVCERQEMSAVTARKKVLKSDCMNSSPLFVGYICIEDYSLDFLKQTTLS